LHSALAGVQPTFGLRGTAPAAGSLILTEQNGPSARPAADAGVALVVQGIVRNVVFGNEAPNFFFCPIGERTDFHQAEFLVPADDWRLGWVWALIAADGAGPGVQADDSLLEDFHLAVEAALIGIRAINRPAVLTLIFFDGRFGAFQLDGD